MDNGTKAIPRRRADFEQCVAELLVLEEVCALADYAQHGHGSRLHHSIRVAYCGFLLSRLFRLDSRAAARAGLLHDLFCYNWREKGYTAGEHTFAHPVEALANAERLVPDLNDAERDAILRHMWPLCHGAPRYAVSVIVSLADKICCVAELLETGMHWLRRRSAHSH